MPQKIEIRSDRTGSMVYWTRMGLILVGVFYMVWWMCFFDRGLQLDEWRSAMLTPTAIPFLLLPLLWVGVSVWAYRRHFVVTESEGGIAINGKALGTPDEVQVAYFESRLGTSRFCLTTGGTFHPGPELGNPQAQKVFLDLDRSFGVRATRLSWLDYALMRMGISHFPVQLVAAIGITCTAAGFSMLVQELTTAVPDGLQLSELAGILLSPDGGVMTGGILCLIELIRRLRRAKQGD